MKINNKILILVVSVSILSGCVSSAYNKASEINTMSGYRNFLKKYPRSEYTKQARGKIEKLFWNQIKTENTIEGYTKYIKIYLKGAYVLQAKNMLHDVYWADAQSNADIKSYCNKQDTHLKPY